MPLTRLEQSLAVKIVLTGRLILNLLPNLDLKALTHSILSIASPDQECCGFYYADGSVIQEVNTHEDPAHNWRIPKERFDAVGEYAGIWHTHSDEDAAERFSVPDILAAQQVGKPFFLVHQKTGGIDYYDPNCIHPYPLQANPELSPQSLEFYRGWRWEWARCDCSVVVRSYYEGMLGIPTPQQKKEANPAWAKRPGWNRLAEHLKNLGFEELSKSTPLRDHDVILMSFEGQNLHHMAVIVDAAIPLMLHVYDRTSVSDTEMYSSYFVNHTPRFIYRLPEEFYEPIFL